MVRFKKLIFVIAIVLFPCYVLAAEVSTNQTSETVRNKDKVEDTDAIAFIVAVLDKVYADLPSKKNSQEIYDYFQVFTNDNFALKYMSTWSIGNYIKVVDSDLKEQYLAISKDYMVLFYGEIFNKYYQSYHYKVGNAEKRSDTEFLVNMLAQSKTNSTKNQDAIINVVWRVKYSSKDKQFYIVDVVLNNISFLNAQRAEFEAEIKKQNNDFTGFVATLNTKLTEYKSRLSVK